MYVKFTLLWKKTMSIKLKSKCNVMMSSDKKKPNHLQDDMFSSDLPRDAYDFLFCFISSLLIKRILCIIILYNSKKSAYSNILENSSPSNLLLLKNICQFRILGKSWNCKWKMEVNFFNTLFRFTIRKNKKVLTVGFAVS